MLSLYLFSVLSVVSWNPPVVPEEGVLPAAVSAGSCESRQVGLQMRTVGCCRLLFPDGSGECRQDSPFSRSALKQGGGKFFLLTGPERAGEGGSSIFPGKMMTASDDRPARGFIQLFHPGLLVLLEALEVSFCHSSHRLPHFFVTFFFQFNRLAVLMLPFCQHLPVFSLFISAIFCFLRSSPRKYRKYALLCCSCSFPPFCHAFSSCDFPFSFFGFFFFPLQSLQTGLAGILILCVFFGRSGTKGFCFPASAFTPHRGCRPLS